MESKLKSINVVNACMGAGKTTAIFNKFRDGSIPEPIIYISPFLEEVGDGAELGRIQNEIPELNFIAPSKAQGKGADLERLVSEGHNVACTHQLIKEFTDKTLLDISDLGYSIVIDEAVNAFNKLIIKNSDIECLMKGGFLHIDDSKQCTWDITKDYEGRFTDIKSACCNGTVFLSSNNQLLMWEFPVSLFRASTETWVMTYPFEGTYMKSFFDIYNLPYKLISHQELDLRPEHELIAEASKLIEIYEGKWNCIGESETALSATKLKSKAVQERFSKASRNVLSTHWDCKTEELIWTTFKDQVNSSSPKGYKNSFVPFNLRATNRHATKAHVCYGVNIYPQPEIEKHINKRGGTFDKDQYALGEMLQLLWRGCIRNGEPMKVFIPSKRMRKLLISWLNKYSGELAITA